MFENKISGPIPNAVRSWSILTTIGLGRNRLSGTIPEAAGFWKSIVFIAWNGNLLSGPQCTEIARFQRTREIAIAEPRNRAILENKTMQSHKIICKIRVR